MKFVKILGLKNFSLYGSATEKGVAVKVPNCDSGKGCDSASSSGICFDVYLAKFSRVPLILGQLYLLF